MKIRLIVVEWIDGNMGRVSLCPLCNEDEDTTEHVFRCAGVEDINKSVSVKDMENGERMKQVVELFEVNEQRRRVMIEDEIRMNIELAE